MELEEKETVDENLDELIVDLSKRSMRKIERASNDQKEATYLILDSNELQRLDNVDTYSAVRRLSVANNKLIRMEGVSCMINLTVLDISNNSLVCIEGLKDLKLLKHLNLAGNKIKIIDHLSHNINLEYLDLSQNIIGHISDISFLHNLKELLLHNNEIAHLRQCEKNLPCGLETLTLNNNCITDLNEISHLVFLKSLKELSFCSNPCLDFTDSRVGFNYRPFVKNWCSSILILDGYPLDDIECLKAEWLYSQGRGRSFRPGEHIALVKYLTSVCPRTETNAESEDEKKLRLILSKAQHHQQQLKEQLTGNAPLSNRHKLSFSKRNSTPVAERMVSSYHDTASGEISAGPQDSLMTRSLDGVLLRNSTIPHSDSSVTYHNPLETATTLLPVPESLTSPDVCRSLHQFPSTSSISKISFPLSTSYPNRGTLPSSKVSHLSALENKMKTTNVLRRHHNNSSPVPSRKCDKIISPNKNRCTSAKVMSPKKKVSHVTTAALPKTGVNGKESSEEEGNELLDLKMSKFSNQKIQKNDEVFDFDGKENIFNKTKRDSKESDIWRAALCIQRHWRGYRTRHLNTEVVDAYKNIQSIRMQDYIIKVANDMEATKLALEGHRKLQVLQMQAINALWKKMVTLQPGDGALSAAESKNTLQGLAETCTNLNKQVEELQSMMKILNLSWNRSRSVPTATQTEIVAVHTPQGEEKESFPYNPKRLLDRPNVLQVCESAAEQDTASLSVTLQRVQSEAEVLESEAEESLVKRSSAFDANELEREESVCLTPACQEGKDLQSAIVAEEDFSAKVTAVCSDGGKSKVSGTTSTDEPSSHSNNLNTYSSEKKISDDLENQHNGCSFS